jgi:hypothetical protein
MRFLAPLFLAGSVLMAGGDGLAAIRTGLDRAVSGVNVMKEDTGRVIATFKRDKAKHDNEVALLNAVAQELENILALIKDSERARDLEDHAKDPDKAERRKDLITCLGRVVDAEAGLLSALGGEEGWPPAIKEYCGRTVEGLKAAKATGEGLVAELKAQ